MSPSFFLDVFRNRLEKDPVDPALPCRHGTEWPGLDCPTCEELARRREAVIPIVVAALAAVLMVVVLIWLPGIP
jgi:hypothetical protein